MKYFAKLNDGSVLELEQRYYETLMRMFAKNIERVVTIGTGVLRSTSIMRLYTEGVQEVPPESIETAKPSLDEIAFEAPRKSLKPTDVIKAAVTKKA